MYNHIHSYIKLSMKSIISFSNCSIIDDDIAHSIRHPRPASITNIIEYIEKTYPTAEDKNIVREIDLSCNRIGPAGAKQILTYISENLHQIEKINLSHNRIDRHKCYCNSAHDEFNEKLLEISSMPSIEEICITTELFDTDAITIQQLIGENPKIKDTNES